MVQQRDQGQVPGCGGDHERGIGGQVRAHLHGPPKATKAGGNYDDHDDERAPQSDAFNATGAGADVVEMINHRA
jgi:hypothetical protein